MAVIASLRADDRFRRMTIFMSKSIYGPQRGISDLDIATPRTFLPFCILLVRMHMKISLKSHWLLNEILRTASGYPGFARFLGSTRNPIPRWITLLARESVLIDSMLNWYSVAI